MVRTAVMSLLVLALVSTAVALDDLCDQGYIAERERLRPARASSRGVLREIISRGETEAIELIGDVSGRASSADTVNGGIARMLMVTLEDGSHVTLRAQEEIDSIQVGERVAVIAGLDSVMTPGDLTVKAWIREWDLPREDTTQNGKMPDSLDEPEVPEVLELPEDEIAVPDGDLCPEGTLLIEPRDLPRSAASMAFHADAVGRWREWVLEHNSNLTERQAEDIVTWVLYYSQQHNVNHKLIFALIKWESWFKPENISHAGAIGLMQVMPGTARGLGIDPHNVQQNIEGGIRYLSRQLDKYRDRSNEERVILALACYNAGPNAVKRAGHRVPNFRETQNYVRRVTRTFRELHDEGMP